MDGRTYLVKLAGNDSEDQNKSDQYKDFGGNVCNEVEDTSVTNHLWKRNIDICTGQPRFIDFKQRSVKFACNER